MIFPDVRISELEKDVEQKRQALEQSKTVFVEEARKQAKPLRFLTNNPKLIFGFLFTALSGWKILFGLSRKILWRKKSSIFWKLLKTGWTWKLAKVGMSAIMTKKNAKQLEDFGLSLLKNLLNPKKALIFNDAVAASFLRLIQQTVGTSNYLISTGS